MMFFLIFTALLALTWKKIFWFFNSLRNQPWSRFEKILLFIFLAWALLHLAQSYAPPTEGRGWIAGFNLPKRIVESHGWEKGASPLQMLYVMALCVKGVLLAKLLNGFLEILCVLLLLTGLQFLRNKFEMNLKIYRILLTGIFVSVFSFSAYRAAENLPLLLGQVSQDEYLKSKLRFYDVIQFANENLNQNSRVILAGNFDPESFYWNARTQPADASLLRESDLGLLIQKIYAQRITHVLIDKSLSPEDPLGWNIPQLEATHFSKNYEDPKVILYQVDYLDNSNKV